MCRDDDPHEAFKQHFASNQSREHFYLELWVLFHH
jgi:hypothetical protein